jgi:hypothetical protein
MNVNEWLVRTEQALTALENASQAEQAQALATAAVELGELNRQFSQLPVAAREQVRPQLARLLGRIHATTARLEQGRASAGEGLKGLRQHGAALNAYMVSDAKNRS